MRLLKSSVPSVCHACLYSDRRARSEPSAAGVSGSGTHPKKSAWSAVPYREGDSSSSGYSVSLVLSVPSPMAAVTKSTGRMTWAMKPRTSRRVWWNLLMNRAEVLFSSSGKPRRLLDLIRSWSGHRGWHLVMTQHLCNGDSTLGGHFLSCTHLQTENPNY